MVATWSAEQSIAQLAVACQLSQSVTWWPLQSADRLIQELVTVLKTYHYKTENSQQEEKKESHDSLSSRLPKYKWNIKIQIESSYIYMYHQHRRSWQIYMHNGEHMCMSRGSHLINCINHIKNQQLQSISQNQSSIDSSWITENLLP